MINYWLAKQEPNGPRGYNFSTFKKEKKFKNYELLRISRLSINMSSKTNLSCYTQDFPSINTD